MLRFKTFIEHQSQWETSEFQQWFGQSVVRDSQGNPLRVYTGTSKDHDFKSFRPGRAGLMWFVSDPKIAGDYAFDNESMGLKRGYGSMELHRVNTKSRTVPVYLKIENPFIDTNPPLHPDFKRQSRYIIEKMLGHDGYIQHMKDGAGFIYVVKSPLQIKSAIANRGTFDPTNKKLTH
jgi:hypothetical protein